MPSARVENLPSKLNFAWLRQKLKKGKMFQVFLHECLWDIKTQNAKPHTDYTQRKTRKFFGLFEGRAGSPTSIQALSPFGTRLLATFSLIQQASLYKLSSKSGPREKNVRKGGAIQRLAQECLLRNLHLFSFFHQEGFVTSMTTHGLTEPISLFTIMQMRKVQQIKTFLVMNNTYPLGKKEEKMTTKRLFSIHLS